MIQVRRGNDITITWSIFEDTAHTIPHDLTGANLKLYASHGGTYSPIESFVIDGNSVRWTWYGKEQSVCTIYTYTLVENEGLEGMHTIDRISAIRLVPQAEVSVSGSAEGMVSVLETADVALSSNSIYGIPGESAYEIAVRHGYVGSEEEWLSTLQHNAFTKLRKRAPFLYEATYDGIDYDYARAYFNTRNPHAPIAGCTAIRSGNLYGRKFDWYYDNGAEFVLRNRGLLHDSIGVAGIVSALTEQEVMKMRYNEAFKILPFYMLDGINDSGVVCNTNVVPTDKGEPIPTVPEIEQRDSICTIMLPRYILDHFNTAREAVEYVRDYISVYQTASLAAIDYDVHVMVADESETFVMEFVNGEVVITETDIMTNFHVSGTRFNADGKVYSPKDVPSGHLPSIENLITPHGSGLERYNLCVTEKDSASTEEGMLALLKELDYTHAYKPQAEPWYTEFAGAALSLTVDSAPSEFDDIRAAATEAYAARDRNTPPTEVRTWQSTHTCIYDIANRTMKIYVQEDSEHIYEYELNPIIAQLTL